MSLSITEKGLGQADVIKRIANKANTVIKEGFTEEEMDIFKRVNLSILQKFP